MATRNKAETAKTGPNDIQVQFHVADAASPLAGEVVASVFVQTDSGQLATDIVVRDSGLSGAQKTALRNALLALRDEAVAKLGFQ